MSVVEAVAAATETNPRNLQPLYEVVDPDALNQLINPDGNKQSKPRDGYVRFHYEQCQVTVHAVGKTVVTPIDHSPSERSDR